MSDIWDWIQTKYDNAQVDGDVLQLQMIGLFWQMLHLMEDDPQVALNFAARSRRIAEMRDDKWFIQLLNHWELQTRFAFLGDFTGTLELATKATVEVRLPDYQALPQRVCLHEDLIAIYMKQDPIGNKTLVQHALDYMESEVAPTVECYICLQGLKLGFVEAHSTPEETIDAALKTIPIVERSPHHLASVYATLAENAYKSHQWHKMLLWSIELESNARKAKRDRYIATALLWLASHAERSGDGLRASSLFQQVESRVGRYGAFLGRSYYVALTAYHEMGGRLAQALQAQQAYHEQVVDKGKPYEESLTYLEMIRIKKALAQDYADEVARFKRRIQDLKAQNHMLEKLVAIV